MKHQQIQLASKRNFIRLMALAVMLVLMVCCTALWVSAANDEVAFDLTGAGFTYNADGGYWEKTYDGPTSNLAVAVTVNGEPVEVISATLNDYNASAVKADGTYELNYVTVVYEGGHTTKIPVVIKPIELSWNNRGSAEVDYDASGSYTGVAVNTANLELVGNFVANETVTFDVSKIAFDFEGFGSTVATANVTLSSNNYVVNPLPVDVTVKPATIDTVFWFGNTSFTYGDADILNIKAIGSGNVPMTVYVKVGEKLVTLAEAYEKGLAVGEYQLTAVPASNYYVLGQNVVNTTTVTVTKAVYTVVLGNGEFAYYGEQTNPGAGFGYQLVVSGKNGATLPGFVLSAINYEYTDAAGNVCTKVTKPGVYTVKVTADALENIEVVFENNTATLTVVNKYVAPVAPAPEAPVDQVETEPTFWGSPIGICLIVFLALVLLIIVPAYIGLLLLRIERSGRNPVISVETKGNVPAVEPVIIPDLIEDTDAAIDENLDNLAGEIAEELANSTEYDADATEAVADAMAQLDEELANMDLAALKAAELAEADAAASELADQLVLELMDQVGASDGTDVSEEVEKAVADAMAENFNESADATDAIALIEEEEPVAEEVVEEAPAEEVVEETPVEEVPVELASEVEEVEETEEDEEESFGGFGSMPLDYIDAIAEAERYAEMLEQERRGEVQLVTRYRRSYLSRLAQSQGSIQDYYNAIKNLLLSYKGVKSRTSWNFESFNVGRTPLAKFNAKTRTLYIYIALSPEELVDTKYNFTDMSEKKKYAAVPVLLKVKGERKFKHALELITKLCEEKLQLPKKKNFVEVDYRMPFKTTEELVNEGIIKMMVAAIPVSAPASEEAVIEEAPVEETPVEEAVIEETPAEEEIVAEVPAEEAPAEEEIAAEVPAEETPAEEVNLDDVIANEAVTENAAEEEAPVEEEILAEVPAEETPAEEVNLDDVVAEGTNENA